LVLNTVLSSLNGGNITFKSTVNSDTATVRSLRLNTTGNEVFQGNVGNTFALLSLTTDDDASIGIGGQVRFDVGPSGNATPTVKTTGGQTYKDAVRLVQSAVLSATGAGLGSLAAGTIEFFSTIDSDSASANSLSVNASGSEIFHGRVGGTFALSSLTTDGDASIANIGRADFVVAGSTDATPTVRTTGFQTYNDAVRLRENTVLSSTAGGNITFNSTVDSEVVGVERSLRVNTTGNEVFGDGIGFDYVGNGIALSSLTTDGDASIGVGGSVIFNVAGSADLTPTVKTTGAQTYNDGAVLANNTTLTSTRAAAITFASTVNDDGVALTLSALTVNTAGLTTFTGAVGGTVPGGPLALTSVFTDYTPGVAADVTAINGGVVTTTGTQTYNDNVTLGVNTTLTGSAVTIGAAGANGVYGPTTLKGTGATILSANATTGAVQINAAVSGINALTGSAATTYIAFNPANTGLNAYFSVPVAPFVGIFTAAPEQFDLGSVVRNNLKNLGAFDAYELFQADFPLLNYNWVNLPMFSPVRYHFVPVLNHSSRGGVQSGDKVLSGTDIVEEEFKNRKK